MAGIIAVVHRDNPIAILLRALRALPEGLSIAARKRCPSQLVNWGLTHHYEVVSRAVEAG